MKLFRFSLFWGILFAVVNIISLSAQQGTSSEQTRNPLSIVGKWRTVTGNQTILMIFYDDNTYTVEVDSAPLEVGTYSFTATQIVVTPTHVYSRSARKLVEAPIQGNVTIKYTRSGNTMVQEGHGRFTLVE